MATYYQNDRTQLNDLQLVSLLIDAGFTTESELRTAYALVYRESGARPKAYLHNTNGTYDRGLFQINDVNHGFLGITDKFRLYDPMYNAQKAYQLTRNGKDFSAWAIPNPDGTVTGWAAHIRRTNPSLYALFQEKFEQYAKQFDAHMANFTFAENVKKKLKSKGLPIWIGLAAILAIFA